VIKNCNAKILKERAIYKIGLRNIVIYGFSQAQTIELNIISLVLKKLSNFIREADNTIETSEVEY
jgi:hypothetical protein